MGKDGPPSHPVRIGTSGWHYDHWRGPFYPPDLPPAHVLAFHTQRFDSDEAACAVRNALTLARPVGALPVTAPGTASTGSGTR